jgi:hypothetical protein
MPFIDQTARREFNQTAIPDLNVPDPTFGDVFGSSLGNVIDEDLSISGALNREGWQNRQELIRQKIDEGVLEKDKFSNGRGRFDYNAAALFLEDENIKTDQVLEQERRNILTKRRKFAQDEIERGSGMSQFLGMATGYMLDPISIATMPIALPAVTAKSISIAGRALLSARNVGAITAATELAIQPFVYEHKQDIESPYTYKDALINIGSAALGSAVLGGVATGLGGYYRSIRNKVEESGDITPELESAIENIRRAEDTIESNPVKFDEQSVRKQVILDLRSELLAESSSRLSRGDTKNLNKELQELRTRLNAVQEVPEEVVSRRGLPARQAKRESIEGGRLAAQEERAVFQERIDSIETRLSASSRGSEAESDLSRLDKGIVPDRFQNRINSSVSQKAIDSDVNFLDELETQRNISGRPTSKPEQFVDAPRQQPTSQTVSSREKSILDDQGIGDNYNADIVKFRVLKSPKIVKDGKLVDGSKFMKEIDDELKGIDDVLSCAIA